MSYSSKLRGELSALAGSYAAATGVPCYRSRGGVILFERFDQGSAHGNFHPESFREILARPEWRERLAKRHGQRSALPSGKAESAMELDSCNSSDALLMNICCHPEARSVAYHFGADARNWQPRFGVAGEVPLEDGVDATEIDLVVDATLCEAKLTEKDFTRKPLAAVRRYRDIDTVFDLAALTEDGSVIGYQVIRNVLAAHARRMRLLVLCDDRRPDLMREFRAVRSAIRIDELRCRCGLLTWQDLAFGAPPDLKEFLRQKYAIGS